MREISRDLTILICKGSHCIEKGADDIHKIFKKLLKENNLSNRVKIEEMDCQKFCKFGPIIIINPDKILYVNLKPDDIQDIIGQHIEDKKIVSKLLYRDSKTGKTYESIDQIHAAKLEKKLRKKNVTHSFLKDEKSKAEYKHQKNLIKAQKKALIKKLKMELKDKTINDYNLKKEQIKREIKVQKEKLKAQKKQLKKLKE